MQKLWLYLYFPSLQLDALLSQKSAESGPELAYVIINQKHNQVCQLNKQAYQAGIRVGMGLGTAAMLKSGLQVIPYQENISQNKLTELAEKLYLLTSDISIFNPNGLLLAVHNMLGLYGNLAIYWQMIERELSQQQVQFHYATGPSPLAAKLLAKTKWDQITDDMQLIQKSVNQTSLTHTELASKTIEKLQRVGIHSLGDLHNVPLSDIAKRFSIDVADYLGKVYAQIPQPLKCFHPKKTFDHFIELLFDIENTQTLQGPLNRLLQRLEVFLKARDLLTQGIKLTFEQRDKPAIKLDVHSGKGEYLANSWAQLIALKLENISLEAPVYAIRLEAETTFVQSPDKKDLFSAKQGALSRLQFISLLQAKLGNNAITLPHLADDYRPEQFVNNGLAFDEINHEFNFLPLRPSLLLAQPQVLQQKVTLRLGPERIDTGWWDDRPVTRDYFIAQSQEQQWCWVFKTPQGKWFLHGVFS